MRRITLDANVLAAASVNLGSASGRLYLKCSAQHFDLLLSEHILSELTRALGDRYFRERRSPEFREHYIAEVRRLATIVAPDASVQGVATHPEDDLVLGTAVAGQADFLCTRDKKLLAIRRFRGVMIVSPGELLDLLSDEGMR